MRPCRLRPRKRDGMPPGGLGLRQTEAVSASRPDNGGRHLSDITYSEPKPHEDAPLKGILFLMLGIAAFSIQDVIIKSLSGDYSVHQIVMIRSIAALPLIVVIARIEGGFSRLKTRRLPLHIARALLGFCAYTAFYMSIATVPLGLATTLFFAAPVFVTALAVLVLREKVSIRRWSAVFVGFVGIVIALRPGTESFEWGALLAVASALVYAFEILLTRRLGPTESGSALAFYLMLVFLVISPISLLIFGSGAFTSDHPALAFLMRAWVVPPPEDIGLIALCGIAAAIGIYGLGQGYRLAQASVAVPFEYSALFWAVLWGYLFWTEIPAVTTYIGIAMVVGSGLYIFHRESMKQRQ